MTSSLLFHFLVPTAVTSVLLALQENKSAAGLSDAPKWADEFAASSNARDVSRATSLYAGMSPFSRRMVN